MVGNEFHSVDETEHELRCGCRGASGAFFNFVSGETIVHARRDNCAAELPSLPLSFTLPSVVRREGRDRVKLIICRASKDSAASHLPRDFPLKGGGRTNFVDFIILNNAVYVSFVPGPLHYLGLRWIAQWK